MDRNYTGYLCSLVDRFKGAKVAVVGDIALDHYMFGEVRRLNPERSGVPLVNSIRDEYVPGCAGNVARNLASLGARPFLFGLLGNDVYAEIAEDVYKKNGIELFTETEGETLVKTRVVGNSGSHNFLRIDRGEEELNSIGEKESASLLDKLASSDIDFVILSDYNKRLFTSGFARKIIKFANKIGAPVYSAPKPQNINSFFNSRALCLNLKEASEATDFDGYQDRFKSASRIKKISGSRYVVVTCGEHGMVAYDTKYHEIPTRARKLSDVTGAGDTVISVLSLALNAKANIEDASQIANFAAGLVVEKPTTTVTTLSELKDRITRNK